MYEETALSRKYCVTIHAAESTSAQLSIYKKLWVLSSESLGWRSWCQRKKSASTSDTAITEEEEFDEAENETSLAVDDERDASIQSDEHVSKKPVKAV